MPIDDAILILNGLFVIEPHRLTVHQFNALGVALIALRSMPEDMKGNVDTVITGLRFVRPVPVS